jgi:hypothetical protein
MYNFHGSAAAYSQFWNDCNSITDSNLQITRHLVWQAFIQESVRLIASSKNVNLELPERLTIKEVAKQAFSELGDAGKIELAKDHSCSECSQPYKATADFMGNEDPAAIMGADEHSEVPVLVGEHAELYAQETAAERIAARARAENLNAGTHSDESTMDIDFDDCTLRVIDGLVMSSKVSECVFFSKKM